MHENPQELMASLFEKLAASLGTEVYLNYLLSQDGGPLVLSSCQGVPECFQEENRLIEIGQAVCGTVASRRQRIVLEDIARLQPGPLTELVRSEGLTAYACHPLLVAGELLGTLSFGSRRRTHFAAEDLELMQAMADQAAAAVSRSRLTAKLLETTREAEEARRAAEEANRTKDRFLATLSHELRTPLAPVLLLAQRLEEDPRLPAGLLPDVERIRRNVELEARLIDDLLDLTRITQGKIELRPEAVDLHALLRHAAETCCRESSKTVCMKFELEAERAWAWADAARLEQVFWNLFSNAHKFTGAGGQIRIRTSNPEPEVVQVEIADNGIGIEPHVLPHIFNAFEQGGSHITRRFGGLGLGLPISKRLIELHQGAIEARSGGHGHGAVFTVTLRTIPAPACGVLLKTLEEGSCCQLHLLVVEDHVDTAEAMRDLLEAKGHRVTLAGSAAEARTAAADGSFDLVVSDLGLPDESGHTLMRELADRYGLTGIAISGYGTEEDVRASEAAGFRRHLTKPVDVRSLEQAICQAAETAAETLQGRPRGG
ncbi:MAG TPA: ATP-binding protein [Thermoanaerobaculia bacterium]|nr:ATP-binding protein [Thermoanaerobaculia bacterium]